MKIIDNQAAKWCLCYTCPACTSALELSIADMKLLWENDNNQTFGFLCGACSTVVQVKTAELPTWVRNEVTKQNARQYELGALGDK